MLVNDEYTADRDRRTGRARGWKGPERQRITPDARGQLLEQGDRPAGPAGGVSGAQGDTDSWGEAEAGRERRESERDRRKKRPQE